MTVTGWNQIGAVSPPAAIAPAGRTASGNATAMTVAMLEPGTVSLPERAMTAMDPQVAAAAIVDVLCDAIGGGTIDGHTAGM